MTSASQKDKGGKSLGSLRLINGTSDHMLSQKKEKAICKNIFGEWTSRAKIIFYKVRFYLIMAFAKLGLLEGF